MIKASGRLDRRIQIQSQSTVQDTFGQRVNTWTTFYTCWASLDIVKAQLLYNTGDFVDKATQYITIRYTSSQTFSIGDRIIYSEPTTGIVHTYEIQSVLNPEQANVYIQFLAYELFGLE
ncbi:MAG TPA: phage head closure protein [Acidobacteriaceae bacterium]|nr:phage head closure protein [Acidobacteriaceae bacterium]